tara:strand:+ start:179 stop:520 length:342 start_codon:yes stop_codon:yes gene_type:complete
MLVNCNDGCILNNGTTEVKLDENTGKVVCLYCGDNVNNISNYIIGVMKSVGDVIKEKPKKAFVFECKECNKYVNTVNKNGEVFGVGCDSGACNIDITSIMKDAVSLYKDDNDI